MIFLSVCANVKSVLFTYFVVYINNFHLIENIKYYMEKITMVDVTSNKRNRNHGVNLSYVYIYIRKMFSCFLLKRAKIVIIKKASAIPLH